MHVQGETFIIKTWIATSSKGEEEGWNLRRRLLSFFKPFERSTIHIIFDNLSLLSISLSCQEGLFLTSNPSHSYQSVDICPNAFTDKKLLPKPPPSILPVFQPLNHLSDWILKRSFCSAATVLLSWRTPLVYLFTELLSTYQCIRSC